jgi:hypothetical protein
MIDPRSRCREGIGVSYGTLPRHHLNDPPTLPLKRDTRPDAFKLRVYTLHLISDFRNSIAADRPLSSSNPTASTARNFKAIDSSSDCYTPEIDELPARWYVARPTQIFVE